MIDCSTIDDIEWNESIPDGPIEIDGVYLTNYDEDDDMKTLLSTNTKLRTMSLPKNPFKKNK